MGPKSKIRHGSSMQNIVADMCGRFHNDRLRNDRALVLWKSDNNKNPKNNVVSALVPVSGSKNAYFTYCVWVAGPQNVRWSAKMST